MGISVASVLSLVGLRHLITKEQTVSPYSNTRITLGKPVSKPPSAMEIEKAKAVLQRHADAIEEQHKLAVITCPSCKNEQLVKDTTHVTDHWYESPYGCTGGDNWLTNYGSDRFVCNACNAMHILPPEWNSKNDMLTSKRRFFAASIKSYDGKIES